MDKKRNIRPMCLHLPQWSTSQSTPQTAALTH